MWCTCPANHLLLFLLFWPFLLALHKDSPLIPWLFHSEALSNMHFLSLFYKRRKGGPQKEKEHYQSCGGMLKLPSNCNKNICRKIQMGFTELWVTWKVLWKICQYLLILKYRKISGTSYYLFMRPKMSCHIVFPAGNTFLFKFRLDKFRSRNLLRHVKHEDLSGSVFVTEATEVGRQAKKTIPIHPATFWTLCSRQYLIA